MKICKCRQSDLSEVYKILSSYNLPTKDIDIHNCKDFWVAEEQGHILGVGGLEKKGYIGMVRSLAVIKEHLGKGLGKKIYIAIEKYAVEEGILRLYLLTTTAENFFKRLNYEVIDRDIAPVPIQKTSQFNTLCPQTAVLMQKSINIVEGRKEFDSGLYCAESVLSVVAEYFGIQSDLIPGIATGFCSGMGRTAGTCGALTGGILAINMIYGRKSSNDSLERDYKAVQNLVDRFIELYGTINCAELLDCDLGTESGQLKFTTNKLHRRCREYTGMAADLTVKLIEGKNLINVS